jgi:hypothetical protein
MRREARPAPRSWCGALAFESFRALKIFAEIFVERGAPHNEFFTRRSSYGRWGAALIERIAVPELRELEARLAALRREASAAKRGGCTPSEILKLRRDCTSLWAAVERLKYAGAPTPASPSDR